LAEKKILKVILAGTTWLAIWTFWFCFYWSRYASVSSNVFYQWLRHAGLGEITEINAPYLEFSL
jgi:hypothetical protein